MGETGQDTAEQGQLLSALWEQQARIQRSRPAPLSSVGATGQDTAEQGSSSQLCGSNRPGHGGAGQLLSALWEKQARTRRSRASSSQLCGSNRPGYSGAGQLLSALWEQQARTRRSRAAPLSSVGATGQDTAEQGQLLSALWEQQARIQRSRPAPLSSVGATGQDTAEQGSSSQLCGSNRPGHGGTGQLLSALWEQQARTRRNRPAPLSSVGATGQDTAEQGSSSQLCGSNRPGHGGAGQLLSALWEQQARTRRSRSAPLSSEPPPLHAKTAGHCTINQSINR
ncbi:autotransporter adhesin BpaC-like isoform X4 [Coregonus clupeaformis]|uniref:autotransporter adhesin BpaC-like isoform X2 n=1 Tax=Coregonus clupeaformis TaxID=59861 RepID=UPI001E1C3811|nr:autotransporter adhesin BpaC-like isoform X2 [Coregonus clupeaformis]XP_045071135.1 autotransporter adhesin BpaC-like isoform X3 [Coregonus clupeaformis]XP_045071136.1 autotransporter adhesin BpaC-like isoform X4 [Coregonus clupeaformis]